MGHKSNMKIVENLKKMQFEYKEMREVCVALWIWLGNIPFEVFNTLDESIKDRLTDIVNKRKEVI